MGVIRSFRDLNVYRLAREEAKNIFGITKRFPKEETYSLTDQVRRSSRAVNAMIAEARARRRYRAAFINKIDEALGEAMIEVGVSGATDVTGFGLLGHLHIAAKAGGVSATIDAPAVPFLAGTAELASAGMIPGGTRSNHAFVDPHTDWGELPELERMMLADAQTSGGMLIAVPRERVAALRAALEARGVPAAEVGGIEAGPAGRIGIRGRLARNTGDGEVRSGD